MPLWLAFKDNVVFSPDSAHFTQWQYEFEPPFADGVFRGHLLPERFWGRGHAWSPRSDYFSLEQYAGTLGSEWFVYVVRVSDGRWFRVTENARVEYFAYPTIEFCYAGTKNDGRSQYEFTGNEQWTAPS
jgi:hypothetical protein